MIVLFHTNILSISHSFQDINYANDCEYNYNIYI